MSSSDRSSNPLLSEKAFKKAQVMHGQGVMTIDGVVNKSLVLLFLLCAAFIVVWTRAFAGDNDFVLSATLIGVFGGLVACLVASFVPTSTPIVAPIYAVLEGLAIGGISSFMERRYPGIVTQAVTVTFSVFFVLLLGYRTRVFRVTAGFRKGVIAMTLGLLLIYLVNFGMSFFGTSLPFVTGGGWMGIGFSLLAAGLASMSLLLDFDFIESQADQGAPKFMEWYAAFGMLVTLIWLYMEVLRLLGKGRD